MENITLTSDQFEALLTRLGAPLNQSLAAPQEPDEDDLCAGFISEVLQVAARPWFRKNQGKFADLRREVIGFLKERL